MPIKIPVDLPAAKTLLKENIFVMDVQRAVTQDIRPLHILILNLMPTKITTETQLRYIKVGKRRKEVHVRRIIVPGEERKRRKAAVIAEKLRPRRQKRRIVVAFHIKIKCAYDKSRRSKHCRAYKQRLILKNALAPKEQHGKSKYYR